MTTPRTDDTTPHLPWAQTQTLPYAAPADPAPVPSAPTDPAPTEVVVAHQAAPDTAPALNPPTWSGRKTAIAAALAIGFSSMGAVAAAAALPAGTTQGGGQLPQGGFGPGGRQGGFTPPGIPGSQQGQQQGSTTQLPGGQLPQGPAQGGRGSMQQSPADPSASST
jgi:hypothetical protein